ncbi:uncharacterized protein LOC109719453 isoform X2 [Ananas comosus]|uniref:Uncharacterized protein LOC109719453 isoform X2 n=1 Tax=Ananas comosus TaxID=4615 RepID=A0A6P5G905_ANACO|nr:uncharacterized protein LOC109719453 isoform X2 [Ananas comosus]
MKMLALCGLRFHLREADRVEASRLQSRGPAVWSLLRRCYFFCCRFCHLFCFKAKGSQVVELMGEQNAGLITISGVCGICILQIAEQ